MADVHDKKTRSFNMSRIKSKDTKPEMLIRKYLFSSGYRYRLHVKQLIGSPDIVLPKLKIVIFVHGCFWHGHQHCKYFKMPKTRTEWWTTKINNNCVKDSRVNGELKKIGWRVLNIWECELKPKTIEVTLKRLRSKLHHAKAS